MLLQYAESVHPVFRHMCDYPMETSCVSGGCMPGQIVDREVYFAEPVGLRPRAQSINLSQVLAEKDDFAGAL